MVYRDEFGSRRLDIFAEAGSRKGVVNHYHVVLMLLEMLSDKIVVSADGSPIHVEQLTDLAAPVLHRIECEV